MTVPNGSMCLTGLSVMRPARLAVSSPKAFATTPWDTSWRMIDGITAAISVKTSRDRSSSSGSQLAIRRESMQNRVVGIASSRGSAISRPHASQAP